MIDTEEKARKKVNDTWNARELYIILSESKYHDGRSAPRAFAVSANDISLSIFTKYEFAEAFCRAEGYITDGKPLVGRIDNTDKLRDLYAVVCRAMYLGVNWTDIDCSTEDAMHVKLAAMLEWGGRELDNLSVLMSKEEYERVIATGQVGLNFNEMPLYEPL